MTTEQANAIASTMAELLNAEGVRFIFPVTAELLDANGECFYVMTRFEDGAIDVWHPSAAPSPVEPRDLLVYDSDGHSARFILFAGHCERCE